MQKPQTTQESIKPKLNQSDLKVRGPEILKSKGSNCKNKTSNNNVMFKKLLYLTSIRCDDSTVLQLFSEKGLNVTSDQIRSWSSSAQSPIYQAMPDKNLFVFIDALFAIRNECKTKGINLFDLNKIFDDIRDDDTSQAA